MQSIEILPGVRITNDRCLVIDEGSIVVLGDLHLGYEKAMEEEGMYLPRVNNSSINEALNKILCRYEPKIVVMLGDIKHDFKRSRFETKKEIESIITLLSDAAEVVVVKGNHDNFLQNILSDLDLLAVDYLDLCGFRMEHGHIDSGIRPVIIGHEHPSVKIRGEMGGGLKMQCFVHVKDEGIIVLPPFSPMSPGNDLLPGQTDQMAPALRNSNNNEAELYGVSEIGIIPLGRLKDITDLSI